MNSAAGGVLAAAGAVAASAGDGDQTSVIVPAIVSIAVALLSTVVTIWTLSLKSRDDSASRDHEKRLTLLARRVDALEAAWVETFTLEQTGRTSVDAADLVRTSVWMSSTLQTSYVRLLATKSPPASDFAHVRTLIRTDLEELTK